MNLKPILENVSGNKNLLIEIIDMFCADSQVTLKNIEKHLQSKARDRLVEDLHSLKGIVAHFEQEDVFNLCSKLQTLAAAKNFYSVQSQYQELTTKIQAMTYELINCKNTL